MTECKFSSIEVRNILILLGAYTIYLNKIKNNCVFLRPPTSPVSHFQVAAKSHADESGPH